MTRLNCFKAYDVRGKVPYEFNEEIAYCISRSFIQSIRAKKIAVGCDARLTSSALKESITQGIIDSGCDVFDLGVVGTEEVYFATFF
jgi:phosphomannomutase